MVRSLNRFTFLRNKHSHFKAFANLASMPRFKHVLKQKNSEQIIV